MKIDRGAARKIIETAKKKGLVAHVGGDVTKLAQDTTAPHPAMQVACPTCGATKGALCKPTFGGWFGPERVHYSRVMLFENKSA